MIDDPLIDDPLNVYLRELASIPPLTREEEVELYRHIRAEDEQAESAGKRLLEANLGLAVSIAERHRHNWISIFDLIIEGNKGLLLALQTFAASGNESFSAHAATCIDHAIAKYIADPPRENK